MEAAVASPIRGLPGNLLQGPTSQHTSVEPPDKVQAIRQHVKEYLLRMPAYTAVETIDRFTSAAAPPQWAPFDEIQDEVRFNGRHEVRTSISRNGRSWPAVYEALPGIKWRAGYAAKLRALFLKPDEVSFTEERPGNVNGHAAIAYIFRAPADSISHWFMGEQGYWPATEGKVWVSPQDDSVLRIDTNSTEFPTDFPLAQVTQHIVFDSVQIGSQRQVLPVTSEVMVLRRDSNKAALNRSTFRNYRLLSAIP
jgi:hypothetical protein